MAGDEISKAYLSRQPLKTISLLKYLQAHPADTASFHVGGNEGEAVLVVLRAAVSAYDHETYPTARHVCFIASDHPRLTERLLGHVPRGAPVVFKLSQPADHAVVAEHFCLQRTTAFHSFRRADEPAWAGEPDLVRKSPSEAGWRLLEERGYEREWLLGLICKNLAFVAEACCNGATASTCFAFENTPGIWEVGGLATAPAARRQGLAGRVVRAAFSELARRGLESRYVVEETNEPSLQLARALGLVEFMQLTHFLLK